MEPDITNKHIKYTFETVRGKLYYEPLRKCFRELFCLEQFKNDVIRQDKYHGFTCGYSFNINPKFGHEGRQTICNSKSDYNFNVYIKAKPHFDVFTGRSTTDVKICDKKWQQLVKNNVLFKMVKKYIPQVMFDFIQKHYRRYSLQIKTKQENTIRVGNTWKFITQMTYTNDHSKRPLHEQLTYHLWNLIYSKFQNIIENERYFPTVKILECIDKELTEILTKQMLFSYGAFFLKFYTPLIESSDPWYRMKCCYCREGNVVDGKECDGEFLIKCETCLQTVEFYQKLSVEKISNLNRYAAVNVDLKEVEIKNSDVKNLQIYTPVNHGLDDNFLKHKVRQEMRKYSEVNFLISDEFIVLYPTTFEQPIEQNNL